MRYPDKKNPFNTQVFKKEGYAVIDMLADYLEAAMERSEDMAVLPDHDPNALAEEYYISLKRGAAEPFTDFLHKAVKESNHLHHPSYIGHQVTSPLPQLAITHLATSLLNNGAAIFEMGPVAMAMERNVIQYFSALAGFGDDADGIFTHGGSAGNLTAMLAARQIGSDYNIWEEGVRSDRKIGFIVTGESHYCIARNVKIMGLGSGSLITVPQDNRYRMDTGKLAGALQKAESQGVRVVAVIANSCSTATGSYDDLETIGSFCRDNNLWLHVDGAHGMAALLSDRYRHLLKGIEYADSLVIDFHKMLLVPALNTMVLFRNGNHSYETFAQKARYLFDRRKENDNEWYNGAKRTLECTKSSLGLIAFTALKYYGKEYYGEYIESRYDLAKEFAAMVNQSDNFELATEPQANIVCFRYHDQSDDNYLNSLNSKIRERVVKSGRFYIVEAELADKIWLRVTIINPLTSAEVLCSLLMYISDVACAIQDDQPEDIVT